MTRRDRPSTLRELALPVFAPQAVFAVGQGAMAPAIAITATHLGASPAQAAVIVALQGLGLVVADAPAGAFAARVGDRAAMVWAAALTFVALLGCFWAPTLLTFAVAVLVTGMGTAVWLLARLSYLTAVVPFELRARAMSTIGGVYRIGLFAGPFLGGAAMALLGPSGGYAVAAVATGLAVTVLLAVPGFDSDVPSRRPGTRDATIGMAGIAREHVGVLTTLGAGVLLVSAIRASRQVVLPLWALDLGLSPSATSIVFGISGGIDMLLFYPAGYVMDRRGRAWVAVPSMVVLAMAHLLLPLADDIWSLTAVGIVMGIGNGLGAGIVMTLGADLAPPGQRPVFLGLWRMWADSGNAAGPFLLAGIAALAGLGAGCVAMGGVGLAAAGMLAYWIPRRGRPRF